MNERVGCSGDPHMHRPILTTVSHRGWEVNACLHCGETACTEPRGDDKRFTGERWIAYFPVALPDAVLAWVSPMAAYLRHARRIVADACVVGSSRRRVLSRSVSLFDVRRSRRGQGRSACLARTLSPRGPRCAGIASRCKLADALCLRMETRVDYDA